MLATARGANSANSETFFNRAIFWARVIDIGTTRPRGAAGGLSDRSHQLLRPHDHALYSNIPGVRAILSQRLRGAWPKRWPAGHWEAQWRCAAATLQALRDRGRHGLGRGEVRARAIRAEHLNTARTTGSRDQGG